MDIIFYDATDIRKDSIYAQHNCIIKPSVNDSIQLKDDFYKVISVVINYEENTIHVFVEKLKEKKKKKFWQ